jgi:hypothetical protein
MDMKPSRRTGIGWDLELRGERTRISDATRPGASNAGRVEREPIREHT